MLAIRYVDDVERLGVDGDLEVLSRAVDPLAKAEGQ